MNCRQFSRKNLFGQQVTFDSRPKIVYHLFWSSQGREFQILLFVDRSRAHCTCVLGDTFSLLGGRFPSRGLPAPPCRGRSPFARLSRCRTLHYNIGGDTKTRDLGGCDRSLPWVLSWAGSWRCVSVAIDADQRRTGKELETYYSFINCTSTR